MTKAAIYTVVAFQKLASGKYSVDLHYVAAHSSHEAEKEIKDYEILATTLKDAYVSTDAVRGEDAHPAVISFVLHRPESVSEGERQQWIAHLTVEQNHDGERVPPRYRKIV